MVKRSLLASVSLCFATLAYASPQPSDITGTPTQVAPIYDTSGGFNYPMDSTVTPMTVQSMSNIAIPSNTGRIGSTADDTPTVITAKVDNGSGSAGTTLTVSACCGTGVTALPRVGDVVYDNSGNTIGGIASIGTAWNGTTGVYTLSCSGIQGCSLPALVASEGMGTSAINYCLAADNGGDTHNCGENKFRTVIDFSHYGPDDPVRNFGQPGQSHLHCFFGSGITGAYTTYQALRKHALLSTSSGTDANGTGYWHPCLINTAYVGTDGKQYVIPPNVYTVYYVENPGLNSSSGYGLKSPIPIGLRYVFGFDMDSSNPAVSTTGSDGGQYSWLVSSINAANSTIGHTRYKLTSSGTGFGTQVHYSCTGATPSTVSVIKNSDGSDPFGGTCNAALITDGSVSSNTMTVNAVTGTITPGELVSGPGITPATAGGLQLVVSSYGTNGTTGTGGTGTYALSSSITTPTGAHVVLHAAQDFYIGIDGSDCMDGKNLWLSGGYKNVIPSIWDSDKGTWVCPTNYYRIPHLTLEIHYTQYGWADRQNWDLSSDISYRSAHSLTTAQLPPGTTFHTDWMFGWDNVVMLQWEQQCIGVEKHVAHQCDSSQIGPTSYLKGGYYGEAGAGGRAIQVSDTSIDHYNETDPGNLPIPSSWVAALTNMHMCTGGPNQNPANNSAPC